MKKSGNKKAGPEKDRLYEKVDNTVRCGSVRMPCWLQPYDGCLLFS
jgi:hypothetical protein